MSTVSFSSKLPFAKSLLLLAVGLLVPSLFAQGYTFTTFAGMGGRAGSTDGAGGAIGVPLFYNPSGLAVDGSGNIFVADTNNYLIRKITSGGTVTTLAGTSGTFGTVDGTGTAASFGTPMGPAMDSSGNIYVADYTSAVIRKITSAGVVTTFAGTANSTGAADGTGAAARFFHPSAVAVDSTGNVYVADSGNSTIRKITSAGVVTTLAGKVGVLGILEGTGTDAAFNNPRGLATDSAGNIYVADTGNNCIRKVTAAGAVTTLAGLANAFGGADGTGAAARFNFPNSVAVDNAGNIYVADELNSTVRKVTSGGVVTTLAGTAGTEGRADGTGAAAKFNRPTGVAVDGSGGVYLTDYNNHLIRKISPAGVVTTVAGTGGVSGMQDGFGYLIDPTSFYGPTSTATDAAGNVYVADTGNHTIRKVTPAGVLTTFAGTARTTGTTDAAGSLARFYSPAAVATDTAGNVYVADTGNHTIRKASPAGVVTTLAGTATVAGNADGLGTAASFNAPSSVTVDGAGNVYVADYGNHTIRKIAPGGQVTTLAGTAGLEGTLDGVGGAARFSFPRSIAVDASGNVYVADTGNHTIRKIAPGGLVVTLAGSAGNAGSADGTGSVARFNGPGGVAVDLAGNVSVADTNNCTIRAITPAGVVTTLGGIAGSPGDVDGILTVSQFDHPLGLSVDAAGNIYVADYRNHTIRKGVPPGGSGGGGGSGGSGGGGSGSGGTGSTGGTGGTGNGNGSVGTPDTTGTLLRPVGVGYDSAGNFYVADTANNCIKKIITGTYTIFAGKSGQAGSVDGTGAAALFNGPTGLTVDNADNVFVCDSGNGTVRKITSAGVVTTVAGTAGSRGSTDGTGSAALFSSPSGITVDAASNLYVVDSINDNIRKITSTGVVTTVAGTARTVGEADGVGTAALFNNPVGITIDGFSNLYVSDTYNNTIRKIASIATTTTATDGTVTTIYSTGTTVSTIAGSPGLSGSFDGIGGYALFSLPTGVSVDRTNQYIYLTDTGNNCIRRITSTGLVQTVAGIAGIAGNRNGSVESSLFNQPQGLVIYNNSTNIIVIDTGNSSMRRINSLAAVSTITLTASTVTPTTTTTGTPTTSSSSGGGVMEAWFAGSLLLLYGLSRRGRQGKLGC